ncbi:pentapeptide repeat-containing protein [Halotia branconii]|uniref:Pentapeptide repeat-containing protein n=1 Tax=Halotia branconii CENA392 TaxID=1539056 RepID=A0AAJ6NUJ1_9CYAN|nr:pentapeptide repeat-containing protein [Halotia branconii]WGV26983.1 pentapeptide repeat-containing protein [Halotia branconii CENA392]
MANKIHLNKLAEGVTAWNDWRTANPNIDVDLSGVYLVHEVSIRNQKKAWRLLSSLISLLITLFLLHTNLTDYLIVFFENNPFFKVNFSAIAEMALYITIRFSLFLMIMLTVFPGLELMLNYSKGKLNLININMNKVNLYGTDLKGVDLRYADLNWADLRNSNLSYLEAVGANLSYANFTGACIANWNIDSSTNLNNIKCDYIYYQFNYELNKFDQRRPIDINSIFAPNEFTERIKITEKALETIDLTFTDGIDWKAFFKSFNELRQQYPEHKIDIQGIERKSNTLIVRLDVNIESDINTFVIKGSLETGFKEVYENQLKLLEAQYRRELQAKDDDIIFYRHQSTNLLEIIRQQTTRPITVEHIMSEIYNNDFKEVNIGNFANKNSDYAQQQANQYIHISEQKQTLAEAAAKIQRLLKELEQNKPAANENEKICYVNDETTPNFKRRVIGALQGGSEAAIEEFLDNSYINIGKAIIKGWIKPN